MGEMGGGRHGPVERLWRAVRQHPNDLTRRAVLADELQARGDAFGELIAVQLALDRLEGASGAAAELDDVRGALMARQASLLENPTVHPCPDRTDVELSWSGGFIGSARVAHVKALDAVLGHRASWLLRSMLFLGSLDDLNPLLRVIERAPPRPIELFRFGSRGQPSPCRRPFSARALAKALPHLRRLALWACQPELHDLRAPRLQAMLLNPIEHEVEMLEAMSLARLPALTRLVISVADSGVELPRRLLLSAGLPRLETLCLDGAFLPDVVATVLGARLGHGLRQLTIRLPHWVRWPTNLRSELAGSERLERLTIIAPHFGPTLAGRFERLRPNLRVHGECRPDDLWV